jgi:phage major head subunit gpT-like protein
MVGDENRPLGVKPSLLVVGPTLEGAARKLLMNELAANGESNEWKGTADLLVSPWLG